MATAIEINELSKRYRLGADATGYDTLRDAISRAVARRRRQPGEVWALRDLNLAVEQGEVLGIVGDNGAGKTTLLKILAGITEPTAGEARVRGRVGALLDVGTGFHSELTGRENAYLSGAILGMRRREVDELFDEIIEFSGLERFVDTPVKRYSAGMRLRLGFAVAAYIRPAILVVDEILAVGDATFREKCLGRMAEISSHSRTVLFVSHDLGAVSNLCSRAIWLENGRIRGNGPPTEVVGEYLSARSSQSLHADFELSDSEVAVAHASVRSANGHQVTEVPRDAAFTIQLELFVREQIPGLDVAVLLRNSRGTEVIDAARSDHRDLGALGRGRHRIAVEIPGILAPDRYTVLLWTGTRDEEFLMRELITIPITPRPDDPMSETPRRRVVQPEVTWREHLEPDT